MNTLDILPLWVADMDFRSPQCVIDLAEEICADGNFGYGICPSGLYDVVISRTQELYDWSINQNWLTWLPGMVCGLNVTCRAFENEVEPSHYKHPSVSTLFVCTRKFWYRFN